jgi:hypothetical protein
MLPKDVCPCVEIIRATAEGKWLVPRTHVSYVSQNTGIRVYGELTDGAFYVIRGVRKLACWIYRNVRRINGRCGLISGWRQGSCNRRDR